MATFAIPQADKLCMDYEARMHSLLKSTLQEERVMTSSSMHMLAPRGVLTQAATGACGQALRGLNGGAVVQGAPAELRTARGCST